MSFDENMAIDSDQDLPLPALVIRIPRYESGLSPPISLCRSSRSSSEHANFRARSRTRSAGSFATSEILVDSPSENLTPTSASANEEYLKQKIPTYACVTWAIFQTCVEQISLWCIRLKMSLESFQKAVMYFHGVIRETRSITEGLAKNITLVCAELSYKIDFFADPPFIPMSELSSLFGIELNQMNAERIHDHELFVLSKLNLDVIKWTPLRYLKILFDLVYDSKDAFVMHTLEFINCCILINAFLTDFSAVHCKTHDIAAGSLKIVFEQNRNASSLCRLQEVILNKWGHDQTNSLECYQSMRKYRRTYLSTPPIVIPTDLLSCRENRLQRANLCNQIRCAEGKYLRGCISSSFNVQSPVSRALSENDSKRCSSPTLIFLSPHHAYDNLRQSSNISQGSYAKVKIAEKYVPEEHFFTAKDVACLSPIDTQQTLKVRAQVYEALKDFRKISASNYSNFDLFQLQDTAIREVGVSRLLTGIFPEGFSQISSVYLDPKPTGHFAFAMALEDCDLFQALRKPEWRKMLTSRSGTQRVLFDVLTSVAIMHKQQIIHRDVKSQNILLKFTGQSFRAKICDFGASCQFVVIPVAQNLNVVTPSYRAPEILLLENGYTEAVDIWSVGCVACELASGGNIRFLSQSSKPFAQLELIFQLLGSPALTVDRRFACESWKHLRYPLALVYPPPRVLQLAQDYQLNDLIRQLLVYDPADRISAENALKHPFFRS